MPTKASAWTIITKSPTRNGRLFSHHQVYPGGRTASATLELRVSSLAHMPHTELQLSRFLTGNAKKRDIETPETLSTHQSMLGQV